MTGWIITGAVLAVLAAVLFLDIVISLKRTDDRMTAYIRIGLFRKRILPAEEESPWTKEKSPKKQKKKKSPKKKSAPSEKKKKPPSVPAEKAEEKGDLMGTVRILLAVVKGVFPPLGKIITGFRMTDLYIFVRTVGGNASETAVLCGKAEAYTHTSIAAVNDLIPVRVSAVDIGCGVPGTSTRWILSFNLKIRIYRLLGQIFRMIGRVLAGVVKAVLNRPAPESARRPHPESEKRSPALPEKNGKEGK